MLTHANDSLTYCLPDGIKTVSRLWNFFSWLGMSSTTEKCKKSVLDFTDFCQLPVSIESSKF